MKMLLISIYDKKTKTWSDVLSAANLPTVTRMADQLVKSGNSIMAKYPGDYDVYKIGEYSYDDEGHITLSPAVPCEFVCSLSDFVSDIDKE